MLPKSNIDEQKITGFEIVTKPLMWFVAVAT